MSKDEDDGPLDDGWIHRVKRVDTREVKSVIFVPEHHSISPGLELPNVTDHRFLVVIDYTIPIEEDAARRIERRLRQAVLAEIADLDFVGELVVTAAQCDGARVIQIRRVRE
jgi:hypothetical protein